MNKFNAYKKKKKKKKGEWGGGNIRTFRVIKQNF